MSFYGTDYPEPDDPGPDDNPADRPTRSWAPVDLSDVLSGLWTPQEATVGRRSDGRGIFYPGKKHTVSSESEAGKTWFVLSAALDEIRVENHALYLDFEDDAGPLVGRLMALGASPDMIREFFHYVRPDGPIGVGVDRFDLLAALERYTPTLAVVDGVTEAMTLHGLDPNSNADAAKFGRLLPKGLADSGAATVSLDHVTKSADTRGRYSLGAVHKLNGLDGAAYILENRKPFGVGLTGRSTIRIAKDRPGQLRRYALPSNGMHWFGDLVLTSHAEQFSEIEITAPAERSTSSDGRPTVLMARVAAALDEHTELSQRQLIALVGGKRDYVIKALTLLQVEGYVTNKTPHSLLKPYLPEDETRE